MIQNFLKQCISVLLASIVLLSSTIFTSQIYASEIDLPSSVTELSQTFSENFCEGIAKGINLEDAGEIVAKEMVKGLIFSPVLKEVMSVPKDDLALSLSTNIYSGCGDQLNISEKELNYYIVKLADRDRKKSEPKPFKPFGIG